MRRKNLQVKAVIQAIKEHRRRIKTIGFNNDNLSCFFNAALQLFATVFVLLDINNQKSQLINLLKKIYFDGNINARNILRNIAANGVDEFNGHRMPKGEPGDTFNVIDVFSKELNNDDIEVFIIDSQLNKQNYKICISEDKGKIIKLVINNLYAKIVNDDNFIKIIMPKILHIRCHKSMDNCYDVNEYLDFGKFMYKLSGIVVSTGDHAICFSLRDKMWKYINDNIILDIEMNLFVNNYFNFNIMNHKVMVVGMQYQLINKPENWTLNRNELELLSKI